MERSNFRVRWINVPRRDNRERGRVPIIPLRYVVGPTGEVFTRADLPPATKALRWVKRRKAEVVMAVHGGLLSLDEACRWYGLTYEEFASWERAVKKTPHQKRQKQRHPSTDYFSTKLR